MAPEPELTGYSDRLSVAPGERISFHVSTDAQSYDLSIVQVLHGDENPAGPGHRERSIAADEAGTYPGERQQTDAGSFGVVDDPPRLTSSTTLAAFVMPTTPALGRQHGIMSLWPPAGTAGLSLRLDEDGVPAVLLGGGESLRADCPPLTARTWYLVAGGWDDRAGRLSCAMFPMDPLTSSRPVLTTRSATGDGRAAPGTPLLLAAASRPVGVGNDSAQASGHLNGKLELPMILARQIDEDDLRAIARGDEIAGVIARWDFSVAMGSDLVHDVIGGRHGRLINLPARSMTGVRWNGDENDPRRAPAEYGAIHFHDDDLDDARWGIAATWTVPEGVASGTYAARLDAHGQVDYLPFVIRPPHGENRSDALVIVPTWTYLAYANERIVESGTADDLVADGIGDESAPVDELLRIHPEWSKSVYDVHSDGSGVCYSSRLRPIPNMRPGYRFWSTGAPERYAADLYAVDWLDHENIPADFVTDDDLNSEGVDLLSGYRVVIALSHPEYCSGRMLDALETYLTDGGRLMYLGGNGYYWVTSTHDERPWVIEVRRGFNGTRAWESQPGEAHHSTTGEQGGLWRYRGRNPNRLVGVGFTAQSDSKHPAAGYTRLPDSRDPECSFIFEGIGDDEVIGDFGLINGGAAGYEIDRYDPDIANPEWCRWLATSENRHDETYQLAVEDMLFTVPAHDGTNSQKVRADMMYLRVGQGEVFSVGSCNWCGSLSHNGYRNNVARITGNVLRHFLRH